jgi:hypothetical protein
VRFQRRNIYTSLLELCFQVSDLFFIRSELIENFGLHAGQSVFHGGHLSSGRLFALYKLLPLSEKSLGEL